MARIGSRYEPTMAGGLQQQRRREGSRGRSSIGRDGGAAGADASNGRCGYG
jgi:hypothetical protein